MPRSMHQVSTRRPMKTLDLLMILGWTHDFELPLQIADAGSRSVAAHLEHALVVLPGHIVKDDDLVGLRRIVVLAQRQAFDMLEV
jgi:hypothetical protein